MKRRTGFSLVELTVVLGGVTALLSLSAVLLARAMQSQSQTRHFFESQRHALDLSEQFRSDVHQARSAELARTALKENELLRLTLNEGETVAYLRIERGLARVLAKAERQVSREEYELGGVIEPEIRQKESPTRLVLSITAPDVAPTGPDEPASRIREKPALLQAEAALGGDWRYAGGATTTGGSP
jgi:hypothetical protein